MNGYTCIKALVLGGIGYTAGSNIPAEAVLPGRVRALIKQGYISPVTDKPAPVPTPEGRVDAVEELQQQIADLQSELQLTTAECDELREKLATGIPPADDPPIITIPITRDGGILEVPASPESIVAAVCNLQLTAEESIKSIGNLTDGTALILIHALDSRKTVKAAAQARAAILESRANSGDVPGGEEGQGQGDA
jgi:hypothetical protein